MHISPTSPYISPISRCDLAREERLRLRVHFPLRQPRAPDQRLGGDLPLRSELVEPEGRDRAVLPRRDGVEPVALRLEKVLELVILPWRDLIGVRVRARVRARV